MFSDWVAVVTFPLLCWYSTISQWLCFHYIRYAVKTVVMCLLVEPKFRSELGACMGHNECSLIKLKTYKNHGEHREPESNQKQESRGKWRQGNNGSWQKEPARRNWEWVLLIDKEETNRWLIRNGLKVWGEREREWYRGRENHLGVVIL